MRPAFTQICFECAKLLGGKAPCPDHVCTCWIEPCNRCGETKSVTSPRNWRWTERPAEGRLPE